MKQIAKNADLCNAGDEDVEHVGVDDLQLRRGRLFVVVEQVEEHRDDALFRGHSRGRHSLEFILIFSSNKK